LTSAKHGDQHADSDGQREDCEYQMAQSTIGHDERDQLKNTCDGGDRREEHGGHS
jgi:hypothetical protein